MVSSDCRRVQRAWRCIRDHYTNPRLWVKDVLKFKGLSRRQLEFAFRKRLGRSVKQELVRVRMAEVRRLLNTTAMKVADIAVGTGFARPSHLFRSFRKLYGTNPKNFRRREAARRGRFASARGHH